MKITIESKKLEALEAVFKKHSLDLVVLFGSQASGRATSESDIDLGVYRKSGLILDNKIILDKEISEILGTEKIDIVIISSNSPVLMYSILNNGKVLYTSDPGLIDRLRLYSWELLAESKKFRDKSFSVLKNKIFLL